jgi:hypothetical protein
MVVLLSVSAVLVVVTQWKTCGKTAVEPTSQAKSPVEEVGALTGTLASTAKERM